jgi:1-acyl-sn-glycerol-3-phosphate acyltransferase
VVSGLAVALWLVSIVRSDDRKVRHLVRQFTKLLVRASGCQIQVSGATHLTETPGAVLVSNHGSFADSIVLLASLPADFRFVVNHRAAKYPFIGLPIRRSGHLVVDRNSLQSRAACGLQMRQVLATGGSVLIYPEGTAKTRSGIVAPFRNGAFRAAVRTRCPVIPIAVSGTRAILPRSFALLRRANVHIQVLPALDVHSSPDAHQLRRAAHEAIAAALVAD